MPKTTSKVGSELFIVDNSDEDWSIWRTEWSHPEKKGGANGGETCG